MEASAAWLENGWAGWLGLPGSEWEIIGCEVKKEVGTEGTFLRKN